LSVTEMKRILTFLLLLLLPLNALAVQTAGIVTEDTDEDGFLLADGEFVYEDAEQGLWIYLSGELRVEIERFREADRKLVWYKADIRQKTPKGASTYLADENKPYGNKMWVEDLARREKVVFATNGDYFAERLGDKGSVGIVIRHGRVISSKAKASGHIPTRDIMALYPDGSVKCYNATEYSASTLIAMGVTDTLCFGPVLVRDGELEDAHLEKMGTAKEPRCAFGMVEPGHYVSILTVGRTKDSDGVRLAELGRMMYEAGCTEAINLDGGQTAVMCFMGRQISETGSTSTTTKNRKMTDIIGFGYSQRVTE